MQPERWRVCICQVRGCIDSMNHWARILSHTLKQLKSRFRNRYSYSHRCSPLYRAHKCFYQSWFGDIRQGKHPHMWNWKRHVEHHTECSSQVCSSIRDTLSCNLCSIKLGSPLSLQFDSGRLRDTGSTFNKVSNLTSTTSKRWYQ